MPDQFTEATFGGQPIVKMVPDLYPDAAGMANGYINPLGTEPGIGYVLMFKRDLDKLTIGTNIRSSYPLVFTAGQSAVIPALWIVSAVQVSRGPGGAPDSVYMVKLTDRRWFARMSSALKQYNVRCPAPPTLSLTDPEVYYADSLNSGSPWTWELMTRDLWNQITALGSSLPLPYAPDGTPEDWQFLGTSAYDGLRDILDRIKCALQFLATENEFDIIRLGESQPGLAALLLANQSYLKDAAPVDSIVALGAETVKVYFQNRDQHYGTEQSTTRSGNAWTTAAMHVESIASGLVGPLTGTTVAILDDLPAITDFDGAVLNGTELTDRATERALNYRNEILTSARRARLLYQGIIPQFLPGSEIKSVAWRNYGDGWVTEVFNAPTLAGIDPGSGSAGGSAVPNDALAPPDLGRSSFPIYPPVLHLCTIDGGSDGALTGPNAGRLYAAKVNRVDPSADWTTPDAYEAGDACWVAVVNLLTGSDNALSRLERGERYFCRLNGTADYGGDVRPLYLLYRPENYVYHVTIAAGPVVPGASTSVTLPDGRVVSATNHTQTTYATSDKATVYWDVVSGAWYLVGAGSDDTPDNMAIVNIYTTTADANGLWQGQVAVPNVVNDFSTDQFPGTGGDCWVVVLNTVGGSIDAAPVTLKIGEHYIGRHFGDFDNGDTTFTPIYAIRVEDELYAARCPTPGVGPGASINITLLDGRVVSCLNWSDSSIATDDKIHIYHDLEIDQWTIIGPATPSKNVYSATADADIAAGAAGDVILSDVTTQTATNWSLDLPIANGDKVFAVKEATAGTYFTWKSGEKSIEAWHITLAAPFAAGATGSVTLPNAVVVTARNWSDNALVTGDKVVVLQNYPRDDWFLIKSGGDADAIVRPYSASPDGNCLYAGKLVALAGGFAGACSPPFVDGADIYLLVMDAASGSWGSGEPLNPAEYYQARKVGSLGGVDVYAIRTGTPAALTRFQLIADLRIGIPPSGDNATVVTWDSGSSDWSIAGNPDIEVWDMTPSARTFEGLAAQSPRGWAQFNNDSGRYEIVWMEHTAKFVGFETRDGAHTGGDLRWIADGLSPADPIVIQDTDDLFPRRLTGAIGIGLYDPGAERYVIVQSETQAGFVLGTIDAAMDLEANDVSFTKDEAWGTQQDVQTPVGTLTLYQRLYAHAPAEAEAIAALAADEDIYYPLIVDQEALLYACTLGADLLVTDINATIAVSSAMSMFPFGHKATITEAVNILSLKGKEGDFCIVAYNAANRNYGLIGVRVRYPEIYRGLAQEAVKPASVGDVTGGGQTVSATNVGEQPILPNNRVIVFGDTFSETYAMFRTGPQLTGSWLAAEGISTLIRGGVVQMIDDATALFSGEPGVLVRDASAFKIFTGLYAANENATDLIAQVAGVVQLQAPANVVWVPVDGTPIAGEMWGPDPRGDNNGKISKGFPGFTAIGLSYFGFAWPGTASFRQEATQLLLVKLTDDVANNAGTQEYIILCGEPLSEADGGFTVCPGAYNNTGRMLYADDVCYLLRMPSGWYLQPLQAQDQIYQARLSGALVAGDGTASISSVTSLSGLPISPSTPPTAAINRLSLAAEINSTCYIIRESNFIDGSTHDYILLAVKGKPAAVFPATVLDSSIDSGTNGSIRLSNGDTQTALNWSGVGVRVNDKVTATLDPNTSTYFFWPGGEESIQAWAVTLAAPIAAGAAALVILPTTEEVLATNWSLENLQAGDKCVAIESYDGLNWYLLKTGGGDTDQTAMIRIQSATASGSCVYTGYITETGGDLSGGACSDPFVDATPVFVVVVNSDVGSFGTGTKATLTAGEIYIGQKIGTSGGRDVYAIRIEASGSKFVKFSLPSALLMTQSSKAACPVVEYWGGPDPGATLTVWNTDGKGGASRKLFTGPTGACGYATYDSRADKWRIITLEKSALIVEGTLVNQLSGGSSAGATVTRYYQGADPGATVTVRDNSPTTRFYAAPANARFRAIWDDSAQQYNLEWVEQKARFFFGTVAASFNTSNGTASVNVISGGWDGLAPSNPVSVVNFAGMFAGNLNAACMCAYNPALDVYYFVWVACPLGA